MVLRRGVYWGLLATAWMVFCFGVAAAAILPWWEHAGLVGVDWTALLRHRLDWDLPFSASLLMALVQLFALGALCGALVSLLLRLLNHRGEIVEEALQWALLAWYRALPPLLLALLLLMAVGLIVEHASAYGLILGLLAAIYLYFSCRQPRVAASADGGNWWRPGLASWRTMAIVVGAWTLSALTAIGLHLYQVFNDQTWLTGAIDWGVALAAGTAATIALVFRTGYRELREIVARASPMTLVRVVLDLELRLALLGIIAGVPILVTTLMAIYVVPQLEYGFRELDQPLPKALYLGTRLARGLANGYWVIPAVALLPIVYLAQTRLIWLLLGNHSAATAFGSTDLPSAEPSDQSELGADSAPVSR